MSAVCEIAMRVPSLSTWSGASSPSDLVSRSLKAPRAKPRVLVVDSQNSIRELLSLFLEGQGLEVATAQSGSEARAVIERGQFDLVILGGKLDGVEAADLLRFSKACHPDRGVILFTGAGLDQPGTDATLALGADAVVRKGGASLEALFTAICRSLARRRVVSLKAA